MSDSMHVEVVGRVQGVGFRWFVRQAARRRDLAGWVKNRRDGAVEVAASGPAADLDDLRAALRVGPPGAVVEDVRDLPPEDAGQLPQPFAILR